MELWQEIYVGLKAENENILQKADIGELFESQANCPNCFLVVLPFVDLY